VLEREEAEVGHARNIAFRCADAEHAAHQRTVPSSRRCGQSGASRAATMIEP
jgi:hypothetical protein